jgi:hypothetical protein
MVDIDHNAVSDVCIDTALTSYVITASIVKITLAANTTS